MVIGVLYSVSAEGEILVNKLKKKVSVADRITTGELFGKQVVIFETGIGKVNAGHGTTLAIERYSPDLIINCGAGGAYPGCSIGKGDVAIADKEIYGDEGVLSDDGFRGMREIGIPLFTDGAKEYFNEFPVDSKAADRAVEILSQTNDAPFQCKRGNFITLSSCTGVDERAYRYKERFDALCENMEGAAVAHVCAIYKTPFLEVRGVSNIVEKRDKKKWDIGLAVTNCQKAVTEIISGL